MTLWHGLVFYFLENKSIRSARRQGTVKLEKQWRTDSTSSKCTVTQYNGANKTFMVEGRFGYGYYVTIWFISSRLLYVR